MLLAALPTQAAYLKNVPQTLTQPDGLELQCLASGDEFYNWLHDKSGYVIIQDPNTGYYVYAIKGGNGDLLPTAYIAGRTNPGLVGLEPNISISSEKLTERRTILGDGPSNPSQILSAPSSGSLNNLAIFIRFSDQSEWTDQRSTYDNMFNSTTTGDNSMRNYFAETSYNQLAISTTLYPTTAGSTVVSYQDSHPTTYYQPYNAVTNPIGYTGGDNGTERTNREHTLLVSAVNAVASQVPSNLVVDGDGDGNVDNVCFIIKGSPTGWASLLWPHMWSLYSQSVFINSKRVYTYNFQLQTMTGNSVLCHEMFHSLGSPDLYHYTSNGISPMGSWDLMDNNSNPPEHMTTYMKYRYGKWISSIPTINDGIFTLNPITSSTNNCYRINSPNSSTEYFVVEYRRKTGAFEISVPGSGLIVYRINGARVGAGNADGPPDEIYVYRPGGTTTVNGTLSAAHFSADVGRTSFNNSTDPSCFLSTGAPGGIYITNIGSAGSTITFTVSSNVVSAPTFSPGGGVYNTNQTVTIGCSTSGATIHYTTNGANPTEGDPVVTGSLLVDRTMTVKAAAWKSGLTPSGVTSAAYTLMPQTPTFNPDGCTHVGALTVNVACSTPLAFITYTTNGNDPTQSDPVVTGGQVTVDHSLTLKSAAFKTGWSSSNIKSAAYAIVIPLSAAKLAANGDAVSLSGVVTAAWSSYFYMESTDRSSGIRVSKPAHKLSVGAEVTVYGTAQTLGSGEKYVTATSVVQTPGSGMSIAPLMLLNNTLGGENWYYNDVTKAGQRGIKDCIGLNNIGLLVTTVGVVTYKGTSDFRINDGSGARDTSVYDGVRVYAPGLDLPAFGEFVCVTGIISCYISGTDLYRILPVRTQADIVVY